MADSYQTVVQVNTCYGHFDWHGSHPAGVFLSEGTPGEEKGTWMLDVTVDINEKLMNDIDYVCIASSTEPALQYTIALSLHNRFFFEIDEKYVEQTIAVRYMKNSPGPFPLTPIRTIIHEEPLFVPFIESYSNECSICLEAVEDDKFMSSCKHAFHGQCLWKYLEAQQMVYTSESPYFVSSRRIDLLEMPCPNCRSSMRVGNAQR